LEGNNKRYSTFADQCIEDVRNSVRSGIGNTGKFEIRVSVKTGSCLSPLLFIIAMNAISEHVNREVP